jgi:hypothetical protein
LLSVPVYRAAFWGRTGVLAAAFFWPFVIGSTAGALLLGLLVYFTSARLLVHRAGCRPATGTTSTRLAGDTEERAADRHVGDAQRSRLQP